VEENFGVAGGGNGLQTEGIDKSWTFYVRVNCRPFSFQEKPEDRVQQMKNLRCVTAATPFLLFRSRRSVSRHVKENERENLSSSLT